MLSQGVAINADGTPADGSSLLDISGSKGLLIPRMNTSTRNAIPDPVEGLQIFNTDNKCFEFYAYSIWHQGICATCPAPSPPSAGVHTPSNMQIVWNWNTSDGATGYKWNTANDYATATDNGLSTTHTQTGLSCGNEYTLYVWAYNSICNSSAVALIQSTSNCSVCPSPTVTFTYRGASVTYGTVESNTIPKRCWLDRNLGALQAPTSSTDYLAYGDHFQWGRLDDGHQAVTYSNATTGAPVYGTTTALSPTDVPGHNLWIKMATIPVDWRASKNDNLWQGVNGINNPCPSGFRLPTLDEFLDEAATWGTQNAAGAYGSPLKLMHAGDRYFGDGNVYNQQAETGYWTSTVGNSSYPGWDNSYNNALRIHFGSSYVNVTNQVRAYGYPVRCILD